MDDFEFRYFGTIDVGAMRDKIATSPLVDWSEYTYRQERFKAHKETKTVPIIFDESFAKITYRKCYELFKDDLDSIRKALEGNFGRPGHFVRAILVNLPAGAWVPAHIDTGMSLTMCRRVHVPLFTNDQCFFAVGSDVRNLKVGEMWEINNAGKMHEVKNLGSTDRIHLIADWMPDEPAATPVPKAAG